MYQLQFWGRYLRICSHTTMSPEYMPSLPRQTSLSNTIAIATQSPIHPTSNNQPIQHKLKNSIVIRPPTFDNSKPNTLKPSSKLRLLQNPIKHIRNSTRRVMKRATPKRTQNKILPPLHRSNPQHRPNPLSRVLSVFLSCIIFFTKVLCRCSASTPIYPLLMYRPGKIVDFARMTLFKARIPYCGNANHTCPPPCIFRQKFTPIVIVRAEYKYVRRVNSSLIRD